MAKYIAIAFVCTLFVCVQGAPQFDQHYPQQPAEQQSKQFAVLNGRFHQDPNLEYNFEWVIKNMPIYDLILMNIKC